MPVQSKQRLPSLTVRDPASGQERVKDAATLATEIKTSANLGTQLSQVEAKWINDVVAKFGTSPEVKEALNRLLGTLKPGQAEKLGPTLAVLRGATPPPAQTESTAPIAMKVPQSVAHLVFDAADPQKGVSVSTAKRLSQAQDKSNLKTGADLFKGFLQLNIGEMLAGANKPELKPLADALKKTLTVETPHNQMQVEPGKMGNPVIFYDDKHRQVAEVIHAIAEKTPGVFHKAMLHYEQSHVSGGPKAFFSNDAVVMGSTHGGVLIPVIDENGNKSIAWIDWPTDYGRLPTGANDTYCARLGIDSIHNMKFAAPLPSDWNDRVRQYTDWQNTMGVLSMITVPFASDDARPWNTNYKFNLLELTDAQKAREFLSVVASPASPETQAKAPNLSQYCREGAETMVNAREAVFKTLTPAAQASLKEMETIFNSVGGDQPGKAHLGWKELHKKGKITDEQLDVLQSTHTIHVPFKVPTNLEPLSSYKPEGIQLEPGIGQGLSADPVHMGGLVGGLMEVNFNRTRTSEAIANELGAAVQQAAQAGGPQAAGQLLGIAAAVGGMNPQDAADPTKHKAIMDRFGDVMHAQLVAGVLSNPEIQTKVKQSMAYDMMDAPSKKRIDDLFNQYIDLVNKGPSMSDAEFRKAQRALDKRCEMTQITYGPPINRTDALMVFVPPQYDLFLAQGAGGVSKPGYAPIAEMMPEGWQA